MNGSNVSDLVEDSLRLLDETSVDDATDDSAFQAVAAALYEFESHYESRATFFRLMDVLVDRGYFLTVPLEDHPDWEENQDHFESLDPGAVMPVFRDPSERGSERDNPVAGFATEGQLYVERGSELWGELVEEGVLEGEAAERPNEETLFGAVAAVCEAADQTDDLDLALRWYAALGFYLAMEAGEEEEAMLERLNEDPGVERIRRVIAEVDDLELKIADPTRGLEIPAPPLRDAYPVLSRWFDLV